MSQIETMKTIAKINEKEAAINQLKLVDTPKHAKAGCIGEHKFTIENGRTCPECWHQYNPECELCNGESDEDGYEDLEVTVPWDLQKQIFADMKQIIIEQLEAEVKELAKNLFEKPTEIIDEKFKEFYQCNFEAIKEEPRKVYGQKVFVVCACGCGREKQVRKADVDRGWGKYFSKSCKMKHQQQSKGEL